VLVEIHHVSVLVADTVKALEFYCGVLGLQQDSSRPDLGFPGAWLKVGGQQIHLLELPSPDPISGRPPHGGRDRHLALKVDNFAQLESRLKQQGIVYTRSKSGRSALFCRDYDANGIELIAR
jgi:glyoxylase I family protein